MIKKLSSFKITAGFAVVFVAAHLIAAVVLAKERLFMDAAYYFFHVVNESAFRVEHQRIILVLSQCLLLAGVKMHLSISVLLTIYSITPVIYSAILIYISLAFFKSEAGAWLIMLCSICGVYFLYFCPMYEVCYAINTLAFLFILTEYRFYQTPLQTSIYTVVLITALLGYPLTAFGCLIIPAYHYFTSGKKLAPKLIPIYSFAFVLWLGMKYFFISDYEKGKISIAPGEYAGIIKTIFSTGFFIDAVKFLFAHYRECVIISAAFIVIAIRNKNYVLALVQPLSIVFFVIMVNFGYRGNGLIHSNNFERMYLLLVPLSFAPFLLITYPSLRPAVKSFCVFLLVCVAGYKSIAIWQHSAFYTNRQKALTAVKNTYVTGGCSKIAIDWEKLPPQLDQWSTGMELLMYSSECGKGCIISNAAEVEKLNAKHPNDNNYFILRLDEVMNRKDLNHEYFNLDSSSYCFVPK